LSDLPRIAVIGSGGTISSLAETSLDTLNYPEFGRKLEVVDVLAHVPEIRVLADTLPIPFRAVGSTAVGPADWMALCDLIHATAARDTAIAGFVILHGTATLEETAFFLNLTAAVKQPIVLVGAQRPLNVVGSDAAANLISALRVAASPDARGLGVLVVLNDEIHAARDVVKTSTYRLQTFRSLDFGALGHVDGDTVCITRRPVRRHAPNAAFAGVTGLTLPRVDIALSYAGVDGIAIDAAVAAGARGIVSAGLAPGLTTPGERVAILRALSAGVVVVQSSRAASGRVGNRRFLLDTGIIAAEDFSPQKARIMLMLALTRTSAPCEIAELFATH
jgi:L-asparaginase